MTQIVVDTDVVSFLFKNHPLGQFYDPLLAGRLALISFMTVAEVERWAIQRQWSAQRLLVASAPASFHRRALQPRPLP